jgi:NADPH:quinone reductase-like Zn-dependent oxidoreductase
VGGLQKYSIAFADLSAKIPETVSFQEAATVPVTALTVSAAFHALGIQWPRIPRDKTSDEPILVWGGGSGVGRTAIAFLKLAGFDNIITTAAPKRTEDLLEIGARVVIDYRDDEVVRKLLIAKGTHPLLKAIDAVCKDGSVDCIAQVMNIGGKIACSLIPDRTDYDEHEIEAFFVQCLTFHDVCIHARTASTSINENRPLERIHI